MQYAGRPQLSFVNLVKVVKVGTKKTAFRIYSEKRGLKGLEILCRRRKKIGK